MGEQIGKALQSTLYFAPKSEFDRIRALSPATSSERAQLFADVCRLNTLYMIARAGSGHIGSSFSSMDLVCWLHLETMNADDLYFSSKGHDAPALYSILIALEKLPFDKLHGLRRLGGLPGHPDVSVPGMVVNSGSLGQGISKAKGIMKADRLSGKKRRIFVMTGDGELQEGQIWESLVSAANDRAGEITVIVDHNKLQSDHTLKLTSDLGDLEAKFRAFSWHVERIDGHDISAFADALERCNAIRDKPKVIIADTVKGRGVSFMEHTAMESDAALYRFHSGAPDETSYQRAVDELLARINAGFAHLKASPIELEQTRTPERPATGNVERLIPAYTEALLDAARRNPRIVALDADLILDTGLIPFKAAFPDRFIECGIAEQDMVSQAGGLALQGYLPIAHSFACFLGPRANEQIYTNATEKTKILYVGSLAGVLPGGPGHSHQSVRDISALAGVPGLALVEPSSPGEVAPLLDYCLNRLPDSIYIRLISIPCEIPFALPPSHEIAEGRGYVIHAGSGPEVTVIGYGPLLLGEAYKAGTEITKSGGHAPRIVALPWLNRLDSVWLKDLVAGTRTVITLDNHYRIGGQGEFIAANIAELDLDRPPRVKRLGLNDIPVSGANAEVLVHHGLDALSLAKIFTSAAI